MIYMPFAPNQVLWSEDGLHFSENLLKENNHMFTFGCIYFPWDPTIGEPQISHPLNILQGFHNVKGTVRGKKVNNMDSIKWSFGENTK
jgi:hypothetical protein